MEKVVMMLFILIHSSVRLSDLLSVLRILGLCSQVQTIRPTVASRSHLFLYLITCLSLSPILLTEEVLSNADNKTQISDKLLFLPLFHHLPLSLSHIVLTEDALTYADNKTWSCDELSSISAAINNLIIQATNNPNSAPINNNVCSY